MGNCIQWTSLGTCGVDVLSCVRLHLMRFPSILMELADVNTEIENLKMAVVKVLSLLLPSHFLFVFGSFQFADTSLIDDPSRSSSVFRLRRWAVLRQCRWGHGPCTFRIRSASFPTSKQRHIYARFIERIQHHARYDESRAAAGQ